MSERRFPIMGGPSVPWRMVAPYAAQARANHDQTLERLAERGGLDPGELWAIVHGRRWRDAPPHPDACAWLDAWLANDDERTRRADRAESRARDLEAALRDAINSAEVLSAPAGTHGYEALKVAEELLVNARSVLGGTD